MTEARVKKAIYWLVGLLVAYWLLIPLIDWAFIEATFTGASRQECGKGACWAMIGARFKQFIYGFYPVDERWRVNLSLFMLSVNIVLFAWLRCALLYRLFISFLNFALILFLLHGGFIFEVVPTSSWGGLFLTLILAFGCILCAFPIGILLALGRQSSLMFVKGLCIVFIEIIRGVPLITILFIASVMLPLFFSREVDIDKLLRVFVGITCFQAAYLAEVIRGGLNSLPRGQYEAAASLGLGYLYSTLFVILPQALRVVIPGILNNFIALFKDTTLVLIIGIFDFLGMVQAAATDARWLGTALEGYLFCACVYWVFCYGMSSYSRRLESQLNVEFK